MLTGILVGASKLCEEEAYLVELIKDKKENFYVIAADGGIEFFVRNAISPDMWIGDMDSNTRDREEVLKLFPGLIMDTCSPIKDVTDTAIGLEILFNKGCDEVIIFGGFGGDRFDHSLANIQLIHSYAASGKSVRSYYKDSIIEVICAEEEKVISLPDKEEGILSAFSLSDKCEYIKIEGMFYEYEGELTNVNPLGVSNEFCGRKASITIRNGALLLIYKK